MNEDSFDIKISPLRQVNGRLDGEVRVTAPTGDWWECYVYLNQAEEFSAGEWSSGGAAPLTIGATSAFARAIPEVKARFGQALFAQVLREYGGTVGEWQHHPDILGYWSFAEASIMGVTHRVGVSGGMVVSINRKPHTPEGEVVCSTPTIRRSIEAQWATRVQPAAVLEEVIRAVEENRLEEMKEVLSAAAKLALAGLAAPVAPPKRVASTTPGM